MDFKVINKVIAVVDTLFDGFDEQPMDSEFVLPDYCPDIAAVLKCILKPVIQSKQLSGDRITVDGVAVIQVLYLDEARKCVRRCEFTKPFTSVFAVRSGITSPCIWAAAKTDYVNCRATSPRRLDIHGSFNIKLRVQAESGKDVISALDGDTVHTRGTSITYSVPAATAEKVISVSEVLDLGADVPAAVDLIRNDTVPVLTDYRIMAGKVIIKGELRVRSLYSYDTENGDTASTRHIIPFSQIVDVDGLDEGWQCDVRLDVISADIGISVGQNGDGRLLDVSSKISAQVQCYRTGTTEIVTDAYSTLYPLKMETMPLNTSHLTDILTDTTTVREALELPSAEVASVMDMWCDAVLTGKRHENGRTILDGRLIIFMLAKDAGGAVSFYERPSDFNVEFEDNTENASVDINVLGVEYTTGASGLDIQTELSVTRRCYSVAAVNVVSEVAADETAAFPDQAAALKIYFATNGESVWEVAKACHTSTNAVLEENGLTGDVLSEDTMLLVPLC